jgi:hypothetical protein
MYCTVTGCCDYSWMQCVLSLMFTMYRYWKQCTEIADSQEDRQQTEGEFSPILPLILRPFRLRPSILRPCRLRPFTLRPTRLRPFILRPFKLRPFILRHIIFRSFRLRSFILRSFRLRPFILRLFRIRPLILHPFNLFFVPSSFVPVGSVP